MTKEIPLRGKYGNGKFALVDDSDHEWLSRFSWFIYPSGYIYRRTPTGHAYIHREILNAAKGQEVDHENRDRLDNTRGNLRIATSTQNKRNRTPRTDTVSGYKGVTPFRGAWRARITVNYKEIHLGRFPTRHEAALAYNEAAIKHFGEFANLNEVQESS